LNATLAVSRNVHFLHAMPKKSAQPSLADEQAAPGGAAAADRALSVLRAFRSGDQALSVTELATRTRLYKSTVLRLLASLAHAGLLRRTPDGQWAPGHELARLGALYTASFSLADAVLPVMRALVDATGESVALHVRQGEQRLCQYRVDSAHVLRDHVKVGDVLPLDRGAGGRVLLAFSGAVGEPYDTIRHQGFVCSVGDRVPGLVGIAAPVWQRGSELLGALTLTVPETRFQDSLVGVLRQSAERLNDLLA
jgi:DNA-binding IclR family transcriptional regulator